MNTKNDEHEKELETEYSKGLTHGLWIGGVAIAIFILILTKLFPLP